MPFDQAVRLALTRIQDAQVLHPLVRCVGSRGAERSAAERPDVVRRLDATRTSARSAAPPPRLSVWRAVERIGGDHGYYAVGPAVAGAGTVRPAHRRRRAATRTARSRRPCGRRGRRLLAGRGAPAAAAAAPARRDAEPGPGLARVHDHGDRERFDATTARGLPAARPRGPRVLVAGLAVPRLRVPRHGEGHRGAG